MKNEYNIVMPGKGVPAVRRGLVIIAHGLTVGQAIEWDGTDWVASDPGSGNAIRAVIINVIDVDYVLALFFGNARIHPKPAVDNSVYVLDPASSGDVLPQVDLPGGVPAFTHLTNGWIIVGSAPAASVQRIQIIGGNAMASGIQAIQYAASVTLAQVYDPDVDTAYISGLGNGWLFIDGIRQANRVLVRHDFIGDQTPLITGRRVAVRGTVALTYTDPGPPIVTTDMTAYLLDWI